MLDHRVGVRLSRVLLALVLVASFLLKLHNLGHLALKGLDESFHALVAANLLEHPFTPTLIDRPYVPYNPANWQENHIWLHKGIVPLWQIAISYLMFGVETLPLRLPSAILSTASVLLTYLIGRELLDRTAALIAATLQAFCPAIFMLVQGYAFSDHIDVALIFWVEMGIWLTVRAMRTGSLSDAILAGAAQGLAFLSKMYPALIVSGIALAAWVLPRIRLGRAGDSRFAARHFILMLGATVAVAAPWLIGCAIRFPDEFKHEYLLALRHLTSDVEGWAAPWDRLIFGYLLAANYVFYPSILVAVIVLVVKAAWERDTKLWLVHAWALGVLIPFTLAASKTPSATALGWPALFLLAGAMISRATRGDAWLLGTWLIATGAVVFFRGDFEVKGMGGQSGAIMRQNIWVLWHVLAALAGGVGLGMLLRWLNSRPLRLAMIVACIAGSLWLFGLWSWKAWEVTKINENKPSFVAMARWIDSTLPPEAVLLVEEQVKLERNTLMFRSRRTTYRIDESNWMEVARQIVENGGIPVIVSDRHWPLRAIHSSPQDDRTVYQLVPADLGLAEPSPTTGR